VFILTNFLDAILSRFPPVLVNFDNEIIIRNVENTPQIIDQTLLLISRLERLSADSVWAHRASGLRGALLKALEVQETTFDSARSIDTDRLQALVDYGFRLVENAAKELIR
jgi:hypothetical protein